MLSESETEIDNYNMNCIFLITMYERGRSIHYVCPTELTYPKIVNLNFLPEIHINNYGLKELSYIVDR